MWNATLSATAIVGAIPDVVAIDGEPLVQSPQQLVATLADPASAQYVPAVADAVAAAGLDASLQAPAVPT